MRKKRILELATKFHRWTEYEKEVIGYTDKGKSITKQNKIWAFTEDDLIKLSKSLIKENS